MRMSVTLATLSMLVSLVLAWSGASKARDPQSLVAAMSQLRVPLKLTGRPVRRMVTWGELLLACILLFAHGAILVLGWTATLMLLLMYLALVGRAARQPEPVSCNCFGSSAAPVTNWSVARNVLLAICAAVGLAGSLIIDTPAGAAPAVLAAEAGLAMLVIALTTATALVLGIDYGCAIAVASEDAVSAGAPKAPASGSAVPQSTAESSIEGVEVEYSRSPIPVGVVEVDGGKHQILAELARDRAVVLLYLSATCSPCLEIAGQLPRWAEQLDALDFVVVAYSQYDVTRLRSMVQARAVADVAGNVRLALSMDAVPSAAILGADGLLAGGPVLGTEDITQMMDQLVEEFASARTGGPENSEPARGE